MTVTNVDRYREARDLLLGLGDDTAAAHRAFEWPQLDGTFNWATDWFESYARGNDATVLWIVEEDGSQQRYTFADMVERSDRIASWLAAIGVRKGDPVVFMLGNQVEMWDSMLAIMELGAVIMPTTTALPPFDVLDRIERTGAKHVIAGAGETSRFDEVPGGYTRISVGGTVDGWLHLADGYDWAKQARSCLFAPWIAEACIFVYNYSRFDAPSLLAQLRSSSVTTLAPRRRCGGCPSRPTWPKAPGSCASSSRPASRSTPRSSARSNGRGG